MSDVKNYNINRVSMILGGVALDSGFGEDDVFAFKPEGPAYGDKAGADGEVTRFATNERRFTLTITLMQSSDKNALLSGLVNLGLLSSNGSDVASILLKDNNGTTAIAAGKAWLTGFPELTLGKEVKPVQWTVRGVWELPLVIGGN